MRRGATARPVARAGSLLRAHLANYRHAAAELGAGWQRAGHFMFAADNDVLVRGGAILDVQMPHSMCIMHSLHKSHSMQYMHSQ